MIKVSNTSPQVLSPTASDPIHKEVREARVTHDGTILPSLKHANDYDYNQLDDKIDALSATSSTSLSVLQVAVDTLDTRLDVAEPKITTLQADNTTNKSNITALQSGKADKLMATNLITNGDFSNGTTGWNNNSSASITITNGRLYLEYTSGISPRGYQQTAFKPALNDKLYIRANYRVETPDVTHVIIFLRDGVGGTVITPEITGISPTQGVTTTASTIVTNNIASYTTGLLLYLQHNSTVSGSKTSFDNITVINLTETFGAGNEPTLAEMDLLMSQFPNSWFNGTQELLSLKAIQKELSSKADKVQEAWITPTLQNGATGTVQYMKDSMGFVHVRFALTASPQFLTLFSLPAGYRPPSVAYFSTPNWQAGIHAMVRVQSGGEFQHSDSGTALNGEITFKAV